MYLGNVKYVMSIRHPHGISGKHCVYGIYSDTFEDEVQRRGPGRRHKYRYNKHVDGI